VQSSPREIRFYQTADDRVPCEEWLDSLEGQGIYDVIMMRLDNVERGTFGDTRNLGSGVSELRIDYGNGYRIYYGLIGAHGEIVVLLNGGQKKTQDADIKLAKKYWNDKEFNKNVEAESD
jgi:putative addiction module killer protein